MKKKQLFDYNVNFIAFLNVYNVKHTINIPRYRTIFTLGQNKCEQVTSFKVFCNNCLNAPLDISTATTTTTIATSRRIKDQKRQIKHCFSHTYLFTSQRNGQLHFYHQYACRVFVEQCATPVTISIGID